jgi:hypothetical protein
MDALPGLRSLSAHAVGRDAGALDSAACGRARQELDLPRACAADQQRQVKSFIIEGVRTIMRMPGFAYRVDTTKEHAVTTTVTRPEFISCLMLESHAENLWQEGCCPVEQIRGEMGRAIITTSLQTTDVGLVVSKILRNTAFRFMPTRRDTLTAAKTCGPTHCVEMHDGNKAISASAARSAARPRPGARRTSPACRALARTGPARSGMK